ncbi:MAG: hypothetical protein ACLFVD_00885 [Dehalococcoidia bacterium]
MEGEEPPGIEYCVATAVELPFSNVQLDFAMAAMSLIDIPETD